MNISFSAALTACVVLLTQRACPACAQDFDSRARGSFSSVALGLVTEAGPDAGAIRLKGAGDATQAPHLWLTRAIPWSLNAMLPEPDYTISGLFSHLDPEVQAAVAIDALSSGRETLPDVDSTGLFVGNSNWLSLTFSMANPSVEGATVGGPESLIHEASEHSRALGGDVFGAYWHSSDSLAADLRGTIRLEQAGSHLGLASGEELSAHDLGIGMRWHAPAEIDRLFPVGDPMYFIFSLTEESAACMPVGFATHHGVDVGAHPGDLYLSEWSNHNGGGFFWSVPEVWFSAAELGTASSPLQNLDAVSANKGTQTVVFSGSSSDAGGQIRVVKRGANMVSPTDLRVTPDQTVDEWVGIRPGPSSDEVDGICIADPEWSPGQTFHLSTMYGTPFRRFDNFDTVFGAEHCGFSVTRTNHVDTSFYPAHEDQVIAGLKEEITLQTTVPSEAPSGFVIAMLSLIPGPSMPAQTPFVGGWLPIGTTPVSSGGGAVEHRIPTTEIWGPGSPSTIQFTSYFVGDLGDGTLQVLSSWESHLIRP